MKAIGRTRGRRTNQNPCDSSTVSESVAPSLTGGEVDDIFFPQLLAAEVQP